MMKDKWEQGVPQGDATYRLVRGGLGWNVEKTIPGGGKPYRLTHYEFYDRSIAVRFAKEMMERGRKM